MTTTALYRRKVADLRGRLPGLEHVLLVGEPDEIAAIPAVEDLRALMDAAGDGYEMPPTAPDDMALLHFTSGTTGHAKGRGPRSRGGGRASRDRPDRARPAARRRVLVHGGPWLGDRDVVRDHRSADARRHRASSMRRSFEVDRWYGILQDERVTVWYTAPTALRMLMRAGAEVAHEYDLSSLRFIASVGEPLNPEVVVWSQEAFGHARARQLVADRDGRDHDRQLPLDGGPAGIDGPPAAGDRGGDRAARRGGQPGAGVRMGRSSS